MSDPTEKLRAGKGLLAGHLRAKRKAELEDHLRKAVSLEELQIPMDPDERKLYDAIREVAVPALDELRLEKGKTRNYLIAAPLIPIRDSLAPAPPFRGQLLRATRKGRPRKDDLADEAAKLQGSGLSYAQISLQLNRVRGQGTTTRESVRSRYARHRQEVPENSVVTVNGDLRTLRRIFHLAVEWGKLDRVPAIHELPQPQGRERVLSFEEEAKYLAKASDNLRDATILAVDTGMRPNSELFPLKWADVDLTVSTECPHGVVHVRQGKTESAQRSLPLTPRAAEVLQRRKKQAEKKQAEKKPSAFVFSGAGISGHITSVQHPHKAAIESAGLKNFEFYCWRHTFGTRASQSGMDRFTLARLMGHSSPSVAARYYIHVTETHVSAGFGKFVEYQTRNVAEGFAVAFPQASEAVQ